MENCKAGKLNIAEVYVAKIPLEVGDEPICPKAREEEIFACGNERVRRQKFYAWKLLERALRSSLGMEMKDLAFTKNSCGKWETPSCYFSISHSKNAVAVAVSDAPIGVDVEGWNGVKISALERALMPAEREEYLSVLPENQTEFLLQKWTGKEAVFKVLGGKRFQPTKIDGGAIGVQSRLIYLDGERYTLSVYTQSENVCWRILEENIK